MGALHVHQYSSILSCVSLTLSLRWRSHEQHLGFFFCAKIQNKHIYSICRTYVWTIIWTRWSKYVYVMIVSMVVIWIIPIYNNLCKHVSMSHHHWNNLDEHTPKLPHWATPRLNISIIHNKVCFIKWTYIQTNVKFTYCKSGILRKHLLQSRVSWETVERLICHRLVFRPANWSNNTDWKNKHTESFLTII